MSIVLIEEAFFKISKQTMFEEQFQDIVNYIYIRLAKIFSSNKPIIQVYDNKYV